MVMGSQPIRIQLRKILWEILREILREILVGKSCGKILQEILAGNSCRTGWRGKSQFKKGSNWWKFSIWNRLMGSQPIRIQLGKILWEILVGKFVGKSCGKLCGKSCRKFPIPIRKPFFKVIFKICNSSRSTSFSCINVKNSFLKPKNGKKC